MGDIKLFRLNGQASTEIAGTAMELEKPLQNLFEHNLHNLLGVLFLTTEYPIKNGRIDTLGLDENNCPVVIEYKRNSNDNVITQGLFYLDWLMDHKADFKLLVQKIGCEIADSIDWSAPRLICVASAFTRYDAHAVNQMNRNIELIRYRKFGKDLLLLELLTTTTITGSNKGTRQQPSGSISTTPQDIISKSTGKYKERYEKLVDFLRGLGDDVQELQLKQYVAFKRIKNFACVEFRTQKKNILVFVKINPDKIDLSKGFSRDVRNKGHYGTGDLELTIVSDDDLERAKPLIRQSYEAS